MDLKKGFTLIELLVVIAIIALLVGILIPTIHRAKEIANQTVCATAMKGVGTALATYGMEHGDNYPVLAGRSNGRAVYAEKIDGDAEMVSGLNRSDAIGNLHESSAARVCNIQNLYLLVGKGFCSDEQFRCPSDKNWQAPRRSVNQAGFSSWNNVSFAFQPFTPGKDDPETAVNEGNAGRPGQIGQNGSFAIAADRQTDGLKDSDNRWSINHYTYGTNVLRVDQSVKFAPNEYNLVGWNGNHLYVKDIRAGGTLGYDPQEAESLSDVVTVSAGTPRLPVYLNDSALFWRTD